MGTLIRSHTLTAVDAGVYTCSYCVHTTVSTQPIFVQQIMVVMHTMGGTPAKTVTANLPASLPTLSAPRS